MRVPYAMFRTPMGAIAALSVAALIGVSIWRVNAALDPRPRIPMAAQAPDASADAAASDAAWQQEMMLLGLATTSDPSATSTNDTVAMIGPIIEAQLLGQYAGLKERGLATPERLAAAANSIAPNIRASVSYKTYAAADIKTDPDTSYARMLVYRGDMQDALRPLFNNTSPEFEIFGRYVETSDPQYLKDLEDAAVNYRAAAENASNVTVPRDAVNYHRAILNALERFAAVLDAMAAHADDPLAAVALLRTYNSAEQDVYDAFNALPAYYSQKTP